MGGGGAIYPRIRLIFLFLIALVSFVGNCRKSCKIDVKIFLRKVQIRENAQKTVFCVFVTHSMYIFCAY